MGYLDVWYKEWYGSNRKKKIYFNEDKFVYK